MFFLILFFVLLLVLFFLSRQVTKSLSYLLYRITGNEKVTIYLMAILFFPGTLIHELSHYLAAVLLFVHVGKMEFMPRVMGHGVKLGSVEIGHTDPIRRALIGMAPFFFGTAILLITLTLFQQVGGSENIGVTILTGYIIFEISNTMFSSRKDMEGTLELILAVLVIGIIFFLLGFPYPAINLDSLITPEVSRVFQTGSIFLAVPFIIDFLLIAVLKLLRRIHH
jgi:hypothetical protein